MRAGCSATSRDRPRKHPRDRHCPRAPARRQPRRAKAARSIFRKSGLPVFRRKCDQTLERHMTFDHIAVVGAGAWGCALANVIARTGRNVLLATRNRAGAEGIVSRRESPRLPGLRLDERIGIAPLSAEVGRYDAILLAVPSQHLREAAQ